MHVCPQFKNLAKSILLTAVGIVAVSSTITGHFPPSSKIQGVRFFAASIATILPVKVEPVKQMMSTGNLVKAFATYTFPYTTLKYSKSQSIYLGPCIYRKASLSLWSSLVLVHLA